MVLGVPLARQMKESFGLIVTARVFNAFGLEETDEQNCLLLAGFDDLHGPLTLCVKRLGHGQHLDGHFSLVELALENFLDGSNSRALVIDGLELDKQYAIRLFG